MGRKANYVISNMAYTGWKVVGVVPESTQIMSMNQFRYYIVITINNIADDASCCK